MREGSDASVADLVSSDGECVEVFQGCVSNAADAARAEAVVLKAQTFQVFYKGRQHEARRAARADLVVVQVERGEVREVVGEGEQL